MEIGKFPPTLLERLLSKIHINDTQVVLGAKVGEDAAIIDVEDTILKADLHLNNGTRTVVSSDHRYSDRPCPNEICDCLLHARNFSPHARPVNHR